MSEGDTGSNKPAVEPMAVAARPTFMRALRSAFASWWGTGPTATGKESSGELAEDRTDMAATRTLMAADRTLMAWVRTSLSLSSFGFTIYKVLHALAESGTNLPHGQTPRDVGLVLTGLRRYMDVKLTRPVFIMALLMSLLGLVLFFSIVTKL